MRKDIAIKLKEKALEVADLFSNPDREFNHNKELFAVDEIIPLGERSAAVKYVKTSGKQALAFFYYVSSKDYWGYFFVSVGHVLHIDKLRDILLAVERNNFEFNFKKEE